MHQAVNPVFNKAGKHKRTNKTGKYNHPHKFNALLANRSVHTIQFDESYSSVADPGDLDPADPGDLDPGYSDPGDLDPGDSDSGDLDPDHLNLTRSRFKTD
ncbi:MAG TPA: hypothetical protein V6C65_36155 [Allocoleopsis sp.]